MLNKIFRNKQIVVIALVLLSIIGITVGVLVSGDSQEHNKPNVDTKKEESLEKETDKADDGTKKETGNQNKNSKDTGFEIVEDDSKTQTESVDAPTSWNDTDEDGTTNNTGDTNKGENIPIETHPNDGEIEYGSIF